MRRLAPLACLIPLMLGPSQEPGRRLVLVNPPNGARDVSRMPVISAGFAEALPDDPEWLRARVRLFDRLGGPVPLVVRRSTDDASLALASPAGPESRLLPASDYFLEIDSGARVVRTHFLTGGSKSVLCVRPARSGGWESACDESYWLGAAGRRGSCGVPDPESSCSCRLEPSPEDIGGESARCRCLEEEQFWSGELGDRAYVSGLEPAPGTRVAPPARVAVKIAGELGPAAHEYRLRVDDVTDGASEPRPVHDGPARREGPLLWLDTPGLESERRYRATLLRPPRRDARLVGANVEGTSWTFNTWLAAGEPRFVEMVPGPRSAGVPYPTHLATRPHLRFVASHPLVDGLGDLEGPVLELHGDDGEPVRGYATWYDRDMGRLHLMVYEPLRPGTRYRVSCAKRLAEALGATGCDGSPLGRLLVQAPDPPVSGIGDVRHGTRAELMPDDELWLPVQPTVLDLPHGVKQRYHRDELGPVRFLGHVLLVPDAEPSAALKLSVDPSACAGDAPPSAGCPALLRSGSRPACSLEQALRCAIAQERPTVVELAPGRHHAAFQLAAKPGGAPVLLRGRPGAEPPLLDGHRALSTGLALPGGAVALPRAACPDEEGFRWEEARGACRVDPGMAAFDCAPDGACRSRWIRIDPEHNVWRLWWPGFSTHGAQRAHRFGLFAGGREGDTPVRMVDTTNAGFAPCRRSADPQACALERCRAWSHSSLAEQLRWKLDELRDLQAPAGLWWTGHRLAPGEKCREIATVGTFQLEKPPGAPAALYVKLPAGRSPQKVPLRGAPAQEARLLLQGVTGWTLRGLRLQGLADPVILRDASGVRFEGIQFDGTSRAAVRAGGSTRGLAITGSVFRSTPPLEYSSAAAGFELSNSLVLEVTGKAVKSRRALVRDETPVICSAAQPDCPRPSCRIDRDCRIPFLAADGTLSASAAGDEMAPQPRCQPSLRAGEPGRCSHGLVGQTLITDNVFRGPAALDGGRWYALRLQRNYFEGTMGQELLDASNGAAFVSLLDNVSFGSTSRSRLILLGAARAPEGERPAWMRALAIEGNALIQTTPGHPWLDVRRGPLRPTANAAFVTTWQHAFPEGLEASGLRVVDNVILGRPGGREWGLGRSGGISAVDMEDVFIARNTVVVDSEIGIEVRAGENRIAPRGRIEANLVVATGRDELRSNLCEESPGPALVASASDGLALTANAATRGVRGARGSAGANLTLAPDERERLLVEPLPPSPPIDMELFRRQAAPSALEAYARRRQWPLYEPAFLDDVLRVRPGHRACASGAVRDASCAQEPSASSVTERGPK